MPTLSRSPIGRSQYFTFARRNFLQGLASIALPSLLNPYPQPILSAFERCKPEFSIGDAVRNSWEAEPGVFRSEYGQVCGVCWHPVIQQWQYLIIWAECSFDEHLTGPESLELVHD
jgi:hypothetical protein